jgi:hypothetical protein
MLKKRKKPKDKKVLFKSNGKNLKRLRRRRKTKALKEKFPIRKVLMWFVITTVIIAVIFGISTVLGRKDEEIVEENDSVIGLNEIPTYPNSTFLYSNEQTNQSVKDMLSEGKSAYKINDNSSFTNVKQFYANELNSRGWSLVLDVEIGAEDKRYGQYWIKEDKGLRIYSKYNDIWYETITKEEAENGLSNRVSEEIEIDMLLAGSDQQDLLPDYPWEILSLKN